MILCIDYGIRWCGLAVSDGEIASPSKIVRTAEILEKVKELAPDLIVVGVSEGEMARKTLEFIKKLNSLTGIKVETMDETLTSVEAQRINKEGKKDHHLAAAFILQRWLDEHV